MPSSEETLEQISRKLSILISLQLKALGEEFDFSNKKSKRGVGDLSRFLMTKGLEAKEIAEITGFPLASIRTLLTPSRRK